MSDIFEENFQKEEKTIGNKHLCDSDISLKNPSLLSNDKSVELDLDIKNSTNNLQRSLKQSADCQSSIFTEVNCDNNSSVADVDTINASNISLGEQIFSLNSVINCSNHGTETPSASQTDSSGHSSLNELTPSKSINMLNQDIILPLDSEQLCYEVPQKCNNIEETKQSCIFDENSLQNVPFVKQNEHDNNSSLSKISDTSVSQNISFNLDSSVMSPDVFSDGDYNDLETQIEELCSKDDSLTTLPETQSQELEQTLPQFVSGKRYDRRLLRRVQESLRGVLPPPSVTIVKLSASEILQKISENKNLFIQKDSILPESNSFTKSLLISCKEDDARKSSWPDIINLRYHGLHYNHTHVSEELEALYQRYALRHIGAETASSCIACWTSPSKKQLIKKIPLSAAQSPGRRLSHLARRRIVFSRDSLGNRQVNGKKQLLVDSRRLSDLPLRRSPRKWLSPRKKTPRKSAGKSPRKKVKTPCSSTKKRSARKLLLDDKAGPSISSVNKYGNASTSRVDVSRRALFQSPTAKKTETSVNVNQHKERFKRTLFASPIKDKKRKRPDLEDGWSPQRSKFARSLSNGDVVATRTGGSALNRRFSELPVTNNTEFAEHHKKKLFWAISEALRSRQIRLGHPEFKSYAATLASIIKRLMPDLTSGGPRAPGGTSERMSRIAFQHVFAVTKGSTAEEIISLVTAKEISNSKPTGYVPPSQNKAIDDTKSSDENEKVTKNKKSNLTVHNVLRDKQIDNNVNVNVKSDTIQIRRIENDKLKIKRQISFEDDVLAS